MRGNLSTKRNHFPWIENHLTIFSTDLLQTFYVTYICVKNLKSKNKRAEAGVGGWGVGEGRGGPNNVYTCE
jgi:hypothetical protein